MLLETQNTKENDIIIYSRNSMDENYNYRIIFVNDPNHHHRVISFDQVKKLILEHFQKNLIAYRIVSNFPEVVLNNTKYGFTILLLDEPELIFTDPVFAVEAMENYLEQNPSAEFRFRIQKVGFSTLNAVNDKTNFKEEFCFDMNIEEVVNQADDKIAKALLEKRASSKKKKKFKSEEKRNKVFMPEKTFGERFVPLSPQTLNQKSEIDLEKLAVRTDRQAEGELKYAGKLLSLGKLEMMREEKKQIEFDFIHDRRIQVKDFQVIAASRNSQHALRNSERGNEREIEDSKTELGSNYAGKDTEEEFRKIHSSSPIVIKKVGLEGEQENIIPHSEPESGINEELFTGFVNSLQNESISKSKKHRKRKETDLLYLFKSLQKKENNEGE